MANEAAALRAHEAGAHLETVKQASAWALDQPFSPRPFMLASTTADIYLNRPDLAEEHCRDGRRYHPDNPSLLNGLIVSMARQLKLAEAEILLPELQATISKNPDMQSYYHAARGLISFRRGNIEEGRLEYIAAIQSAQQQGQNFLSTNAVLYWIEQEAMSDTFSIDEWDGIKAMIDANISKLSGANRLGVERVWQARSQFVAQALLDHKNQLSERLERAEYKLFGSVRLDSAILERLTT